MIFIAVAVPCETVEENISEKQNVATVQEIDMSGFYVQTESPDDFSSKENSVVHKYESMSVLNTKQ